MSLNRVVFFSGRAALVLVAAGCSSSTTTGGESGSNSSGQQTSSGKSSSSSSGAGTSSSSGGGSDGGGSSSGLFCATASGGVASGYTMVALACSQDTPSGLAVSNGVVYWTNYDAAANSGNASGSGGAIMSVPTSGGTPTTVATNQDYPWAIAADANNVYWTNYDNDGAGSGGMTSSGAVLQAPIGGGSVTTLAMGLEDPYGIAVDASNVYFTTYAGDRVKSVPIGGGTVVTLAQGLSSPCYIAVSGGDAYWTNYGDGTVQSIATGGTSPGTPTTLATDAAKQYANGIAVSGSTVFFVATNSPGAVWTVPTTGGTKTVLANMQTNAWGLATDGTNVYWTTNNDPGGLVSVPVAGGTATTLASELHNPTAVAADSTGVYTAGTGGHIWRVTSN